jgi:hypothetical protein
MSFPIDVQTQAAQAAPSAICFVDGQSLYNQKYRQSERTGRGSPFEGMASLEWQRDDIEIKFNELVDEWRTQKTRASSFSSANASLPAYQFIIGMGEPALPYILRELSKKDEDWYWALKAISREDPVPPEHRGKRKVMRQLWLEWGKAKKYAW